MAPDAAAEAQAAKRAAEQAKSLREARQVILQLLAELAAHEIEISAVLDRKACGWLQQQASERT